MNSISPLDAVSYRSKDVDLNDVWEDTPPLPVRILKPSQKRLDLWKGQGQHLGLPSRATAYPKANGQILLHRTARDGAH